MDINEVNVDLILASFIIHAVAEMLYLLTYFMV